MVIIKSKSSGRYAASNTSRDQWTSDQAQAHQFADTLEADGFVYNVLAEGISGLYPSNRNNVQYVVNGAAQRDSRVYDNDGPTGHGW